MGEAFDVNDNSVVYYSGTYWNDYELVRGRINERISDDPAKPWYEHFARFTDRTFKRALILNCGNGWVERLLVESGLVEEAVGTDYSEELLDEARAAARESGLPLTYHQGNINDATFPDAEFDLVVNHAAAHHIAAIDRVFREICRTLPEDGWFVSFDYVGPHRNQYRLDAWERAWEVNGELPVHLRQVMAYPPLPVMLQVDPTEAIHAELILETFHRYFDERQFTPLGGAVAYPILTHNDAMASAEDNEDRQSWIAHVMAADERYLSEHPDSSLFAYFAGTPKKSVLAERELLAQWRAHEDQRERRATEGTGEYYDRGPLAVALVSLEEQRAETNAAQARVAQLQEELDAIRRSFLYAKTTRLLNAESIRTLRANRVVAGVERRLRS